MSLIIFRVFNHIIWVMEPVQFVWNNTVLFVLGAGLMLLKPQIQLCFFAVPSVKTDNSTDPSVRPPPHFMCYHDDDTKKYIRNCD